MGLCEQYAPNTYMVKKDILNTSTIQYTPRTSRDIIITANKLHNTISIMSSVCFEWGAARCASRRAIVFVEVQSEAEEPQALF